MKKQEFSKKFIPALDALGFQNHPAEDAKEKFHFPLGKFKRITDTEIHQIEVQIDKYNRDRFRIFFGIIPVSGVNAIHAGHIKAQDMLVAWLPSYCVLYRSRFLSRSFRPEDLEKSELLVQEMDDYFKHRKKGKHIRHISYYKEQPLDPAH